MRPVIAVTGTKREAAVLRRLGVTVIVGGGDAERLARELAAQAAGAAGIVSFGMAGALDGSMRLGDWVIGSRLAGSWKGDCDRAWVVALAANLPGARIGTCYADGRLISDPAEKRTIGLNCGAIAVDMESHIAAQAAAMANLPFAILRCISDEAETAVPEAIAVAMRPDGGLAVGSVLRSILRNPNQLHEIIGIGIGFSRVYRTLKNGAIAVGPLLAFGCR